MMNQMYTESLTGIDFSWSLTNELIVSTSMDKTARIWSIKSGESIKVVKDGSPLMCCRFHPGNAQLCFVSEHSLMSLIRIDWNEQRTSEESQCT